MKSHGSDVIGSVVLSLCEAIDTPRSLSIWLCFKYNHEALLALPPVDIATNNTAGFSLDFFITEYLQKYKGLKTSADLGSVALEKWRLSEVKCLETNRRFRELKLRPTTGRVESALFRARRKIASVLGNLHRPLVLDGCKWGPGATFDLRRMFATPDNKISRAISVTAAAFPLLKAVIQSDPHWASVFLGTIPEGAFSLLPSGIFSIVRGSRFLTVPKNAKTDRCIAAEPTGNGFLQQGVHKYLRRRLKRFGIDLDDQSINQRGALRAYHDGLSTLDLSAASDSISRELVYDLLPLDWALFLDSLRSPETLVRGEWVRTEKFVSMGNAFCFELETLIFWAICSSVDEVSSGGVDDVIVYGDDIIVSRRSFDSCVELLEFCGFTINYKKSFKEGNFFESCGKFYHMAVDVTPVYQKELISAPSEIIRAHNRLIRLTSRVPIVVHGAAKRLRNSYPLRPFPRIPYGVVEDGGFLAPLSDFSLDRNHGFRCHVLDYVPRYTLAREDAMYAYKLRRPQNLNPDVSGSCSNVSKGRWRTKVRWVPEHSLFDDPLSIE